MTFIHVLNTKTMYNLKDIRTIEFKSNEIILTFNNDCRLTIPSKDMRVSMSCAENLIFEAVDNGESVQI